MRRSTAALMLAALMQTSVLAGAPALAQQESLVRQAPPAEQFATEMASSDLFEIEAARIVLERGKDPKAIDFANQMLRDHEKASAGLAEAAKADKVALTPKMSDEHQKQLEALKTAAEADFDQAYFSTQITAHENAIALIEAYAKDGEAGALKSHAESVLGTIRTHAMRAHDLQTAGN
jgi:putative membrane protein